MLVMGSGSYFFAAFDPSEEPSGEKHSAEQLKFTPDFCDLHSRAEVLPVLRLFIFNKQQSAGVRIMMYYQSVWVCVCVCAPTGQVGLEASFGHELSDDVDGFSSGAHGQELDELRVVEALQGLDLLHKLVLLGVLWRTNGDNRQCHQTASNSPPSILLPVQGCGGRAYPSLSLAAPI